MNSTRVLATVSVVILGLSVLTFARLASPPQAILEETINGTISATRVITQNARMTGDVTCTVEAAPCIQFGVPGQTLNLNGFTITGNADPSTSCQGARTSNETGIAAINQNDVAIKGPGLVQRFRAAGILLQSINRGLVADVTASTNCLSGILIGDSSDLHIEGNVSVRNGTTVSPCGGI